MQPKHSPPLLLALMLAACAAPPSGASSTAPDAPAPAAQAAQAIVTYQDAQPETAPAVVDFTLKASGPVGLLNAAATGTQARSTAANAIDGRTATRWLTDRFTQNPTLTVELNNATPVTPLTLTMNADAFPVGTSFDVQVATAASGPFTPVLANQTKPQRGSVTLNLPSAPLSKFLRIKCNNRMPLFSRVVFGITELSATADFPPPPPPPPPPPTTGGGTGATTGVAGAFTFATNFPSFVQYRPRSGRLRVELVGTPGAPETVALNALEAEATAATPAFQFPAHGRMVKSDGTVLGDFSALMTTVPGEPGVVVGTDAATGNLVELIWPMTANGLPGDAIVRVELADAPAGLDGQTVTTSFSFGKVDDTGTLASWTGSASAVVPTARP